MNKIIRFIALMCILVGAGVIAASAQMNPAGNLKVPFSFSVGNKTFEPGDYSVRIVRSGSSAATLRLQRTGTKDVETVLLQEVTGEGNEGLGLVFGDESGSKYLIGITSSSTRYLLLGGPERAAETLSRVNNNQNKRSKT